MAPATQANADVIRLVRATVLKTVAYVYRCFLKNTFGKMKRGLIIGPIWSPFQAI